MIEIALQPFYWNLLEYANSNPNGCTLLEVWIQKQYPGIEVVYDRCDDTFLRDSLLRFENDKDATAFALRWA